MTTPITDGGKSDGIYFEGEENQDRPGLVQIKDSRGKVVKESWVKDGRKYVREYTPNGGYFEKDFEVPGNVPGANYSIDDNGNTVQSWVEGNKRYDQTFFLDGRNEISITDISPEGYVKAWEDNGVTIIEVYDGYGNLISSEKRGTPNPPSTDNKPIIDGEIPPSHKDASARSNYTPAELQGEAYRQFNDWNKYRRSKGRGSGVWNESYANEAQKWADYLAKNDNGTSKIYDTYPHERPFYLSGQDPNYAYANLYGGENVWMTDAYNLQEALNKFIASPGHNKNLLRDPNGEYLQMGIGIAKGTGRDHNGRIPYYIVYKMY